jgi:uncharacterized protein
VDDWQGLKRPAIKITYNRAMATPAILKAPPLRKRKRVPMKTIRALARQIADRFDPEAIILFGSHAYGKPNAGSDVDLLVVMETPQGEELKKSLEIRDTFSELAFGLDLVVRSRKTIERRKKLGDWFLVDITEKGKTLYERSHRRMGGKSR